MSISITVLKQREYFTLSTSCCRYTLQKTVAARRESLGTQNAFRLSISHFDNRISTVLSRISTFVSHISTFYLASRHSYPASRLFYLTSRISTKRNPHNFYDTQQFSAEPLTFEYWSFSWTCLNIGIWNPLHNPQQMIQWKIWHWQALTVYLMTIAY